VVSSTAATATAIASASTVVPGATTATDPAAAAGPTTTTATAGPTTTTGDAYGGAALPVARGASHREEVIPSLPGRMGGAELHMSG
jgi:hypothetical protein